MKYKTAGNLTTYSLWLIRNIPGEGDDDVESEADPLYRYGHFFKLDGAGEGYDEKMFCPKATRMSLGARKFHEHNLAIEAVVKGKKAWKTFNELLK